MLTRTSETEDFAPDASVFPSARDPRTGGRRLEELAFEIVSTERLAAAGEKAAKLVGRGVRRVFAIDVKRKRALVWSVRTRTWKILAGTDTIVDRTLVLPLPVAALVEAASSDDAVAAALLAKKNPVLTRAVAESRAAGEALGRTEALADGVLAVLEARGLTLSPSEIAQLRRIHNADRLLACLATAATCESASEVLVARKPPRPRR